MVTIGYIVCSVIELLMLSKREKGKEPPGVVNVPPPLHGAHLSRISAQGFAACRSS